MFGKKQKNQLAAHAALLQIPADSAGEHGNVEDSDNELWLVSYADLMTLLFCFFVLMYVFATQHTQATSMVKNELAKQFGATPKSYIARQAEEIRGHLRDFSGLNDIEVFEDTEGVTLSFKNKMLFESGSAEMTPEARTSLDGVIAQIRKNVIDSPLVIEGHTDDRPLTSNHYRDNWDLSAARAVEVLRAFEKSGFAANHLSAVGLGSSRPLAPNRDASGEPIQANMDLNRRVVIHIHFAAAPAAAGTTPAPGAGDAAASSGPASSSKL